MKKNYLFISLVFFFSIANAQFVNVHNFSPLALHHANGALAVSCDGTVIYGTTSNTIYKVNTNGTNYTTLKTFTGLDGTDPNGVIESEGVLYGMTCYGGLNSKGCIYKINTDGSGFTVLLHFNGDSTHGAFPRGGLTISGNVLYGVAYQGGAEDYGLVFSIHTDGSGYADLLDFVGLNGRYAFGGSLALSAGVLYGMTCMGGSGDWGCVYKINTNGAGYTRLMNCAPSKGVGPTSQPIVSGNELYCMTPMGGTSIMNGCMFKLNTDGTGYTKLHDFTGSPDGSYPYGALTLVGNVLYGATTQGGISGAGTIFKINTDSSNYTKMFDFTSATTGYYPESNPLVIVGTAIYGTANFGGPGNGGVLFSYTDPSLPAFVPTACPIVLPIDLVSFTGKNQGEKNVLKWTTAAEINNDYYILERSIDGENFETIGIVDGAGNSITELNYSFEDPHFSLLSSNFCYYRLKQTDFNGDYTYSNIISLTNTELSTFNFQLSTLFPNPASSDLNYTINSSESIEANLRVMDIVGRVVIEKNSILVQGSNSNKIDVSGISKGSYILQVLTDK